MMDKQISDIQEQNLENKQKAEAKLLSESFIDTYKELKSSSSAKRSDETYYSEIFDSSFLYFSYMDSCKQYIEYLIKIEARVYRNEGSFQCSSEARDELLETKSIQWIHEELIALNYIDEADTEGFVKKLQIRNKSLGLLNVNPFNDFISTEITLNSVTNLKNIDNYATSKVGKKINQFIKRINTLFDRVRLIPQIERFPKIIQNQFNLPKLENDFFSIIKSLVEIYKNENVIESQNSNKHVFNAVAECIFITNNKLDYKKVSNFSSKEKHLVIEVLTTFSIVDDESYEMNDNLTQLNQSAILSFSEHEPLNDYLKYLDKLWLQKIPRRNSKPVLKEKVEQIVNDHIRGFLNLNFDECLKRIYLYFIQKDSLDPQLAAIEEMLLKRMDTISIENLKDELISAVEQVCFSFDNKNYMPLESAFTL